MTDYMIRSLPGSLALPLHAIYKCHSPPYKLSFLALRHLHYTATMHIALQHRVPCLLTEKNKINKKQQCWWSNWWI